MATRLGHAGLSCLNMFAAMRPRKKDAIRTNNPPSKHAVVSCIFVRLCSPWNSMNLNSDSASMWLLVHCRHERHQQYD
jgi:hypothetical protein